ncbi:MAG TPA: tRNA (adenosine(37)-N6)-threonylcarbamoyltransferase complex dimerization subunit type 1 TsaB [Candidatus Acidoferrales bacterium]|nr:tRNA (adenosine(37)-N6)-threonylcarbamoyltransferase complex dimerization subunit type 1 TsaB [Candidatus Acidoferrales bacterium]
MIVLGLDGALGGFSAAIARDGDLVAAESLAGNVALEAGLGALAAVMRAANLAPSQLDRLATGIGPGGFTGLRITIAYAKSLAQAWNLPLVAVSSFDALELGCGLARALTVVEGRSGVISARYRDGETAVRASGRVAEVLAEVLRGARAGVLPVIGAPEDVLRALAEAGWTVQLLPVLHTPAAAAVALLGGSMPPAPSAHEVRAEYGELPAAKVPRFR